MFRELGATHPESWASSQLKERIPQHRYLWLRQAWKAGTTNAGRWSLMTGTLARRDPILTTCPNPRRAAAVGQ